MNLDDVRGRAVELWHHPSASVFPWRRAPWDEYGPAVAHVALPRADHAALLAEVERLRGVMELIASHKGKTLLGEGTYSGGVHDGFNELASIARAALSPADDAKGAS